MPARAKISETLKKWWKIVKISETYETWWSHVGVQRAFGGSFSSPQKVQKLSSGSNQSSIFAFVVDMFFSLFFEAKYLKFSAARIEYGGVVRTFCIKKHSHRLALSFVIFDFCATRIEYGGVVRPETLRTAPHRRIVMVVGLQKIDGEIKKVRPNCKAV